jgi:hypothetical protein
MLRATWRVLETGLRKLLNGHEGGNAGYSQGTSYGLPRQRPTLIGLQDASVIFKHLWRRSVMYLDGHGKNLPWSSGLSFPGRH